MSSGEVADGIRQALAHADTGLSALGSAESVLDEQGQPA